MKVLTKELSLRTLALLILTATLFLSLMYKGFSYKTCGLVQEILACIDRECRVQLITGKRATVPNPVAEGDTVCSNYYGHWSVVD